MGILLPGILVLAAFLYLFLIMPRMRRRPDDTPFKQVLYAHRGLYDNETDAPENSMKAFQKAVDGGFGIELDVQLTKDKIPVVFHDFTLKRMCGAEGKVADYTYEELQQFSLAKSGEHIPKFEDFLKLVDGRVPLIVEYKIEGGCTQVCPIADALLRSYRGLYCIESFNPLGVLWYKKNRREVFRGQLSENFIRAGEREMSPLLYFALHHLLFNFLAKPDFIAYCHEHYRDLSRVLCRKLYKAPAVAWTIRSEEELQERRKNFDIFIFEGFVPK